MLPNTISQDRAKNWTSLHDAAANGDEEMIKTLLAGHADPIIKELKFGNTALHEAASRGYSRSVKILCASSANKTHSSKDKRRSDTHKEASGVVRASVLSIQNHAGFTALHLAAQNGHNQSCREILLSNANPDIENYYGDTALHTACRYGHAGAARILISAFCDVNKRNLNGDTPLHITSAMGRHKLSRILLEADCDINARNAQGETPRDIAIRKGYSKILDILDNPHRIRNRHTKQTATAHEDKTKATAPHTKILLDQNEISWSPYGCHYFPDPRSFPSPKLETLPKEPLKRGEQYYLDLAGHIRKGPIGIGNICYCGPFFKHIEDKINSNRKQLRKCVHNAKEHMDDKVQALAARTNHQIEKLTRTMIADRVQCENRRLYLENYLKRGDPLRLTTDIVTRRKQSQDVLDGTLKRCRSLELLEKIDGLENRLGNSRSYDLLEQDTGESNPCRCDVAYVVQASKSNALVDDGANEVNDEFHDVSKRLGSLLAKTSTFLKDPENKQNKQEQPPHNAGSSREIVIEKDKHVAHPPKVKHLNNTTDVLQKCVDDTVLNGDLGSQILHSRASTSANEASLSPGSNLSNGLELGADDGTGFAPTPPRNKADIQYLYDIQRRGNVIKNVISALRKSHQKVDITADVATHNDSEYTQEDKLGYKGEKTLINGTELFQLTRNYMHTANNNNTAELETLDLPAFAMCKGTTKINECTRRYQQAIRSSQKEHTRSSLQARNGDYDSVNAPNNREELLAAVPPFGAESTAYQYESLYSGSQSSDNGQAKMYSPVPQQTANRYTCNTSMDGLTLDQFHETNKQSLTSNSTSSHSMRLDDAPVPQLNIQNNYWTERFIPKDAYFHDIKRRAHARTDSNPNTYNLGVKQVVASTQSDIQNNVQEKSHSPQLLSNQYVHQAKLHPTAPSIASVKSFNKKLSSKTEDNSASCSLYSRNCCVLANQEQNAVILQIETASGNQQNLNNARANKYDLVQQVGINSAGRDNHMPTEKNSPTLKSNQKPGYDCYAGDEHGMLNVQPKLPTSVFYASNVSSLV